MIKIYISIVSKYPLSYFAFICLILFYVFAISTFHKTIADMGKEIIESIRDNYSMYNKLLKERKSIFDAVIDISKPNNNANTLETIKAVKHPTLENSIVFIVNVKVNNHNFFQFKLRCKDLSGKPFFRFDSDGETHRNYDDDIPIDEQQVTPPHFHFYNEKGINIAYKTSQLQNEAELKALEDINLCVKHFCHEANLFLDDDNFPEITIMPSNLPFKFSQIDPTENVIFK